MLRRLPILRSLGLVGPAFVAAVAYIDPGNVAVNITAGAQFGFMLIWVVVLANFMAMLIQYLSAKLGLVTGISLAGHVARTTPRPVRVGYWVQAEMIAIATDMAEIVGGAIALNLLFDIDLVLGTIITTVVSILILRFGDHRGQAVLERTLMFFIAMIAIGFTAGLFLKPLPIAGITSGLVPNLAGNQSILLASAIIGATVMPHVIYLHSSLTADKLGDRGANKTVKQLLSATKVDVVLALLLAGTLNIALMVLAADNLYQVPGTETLRGVYEVISSNIGAGVALLFAVALLSSGLASTSVGTAFGAEVMGSLIKITIPVTIRRILTVIPAVVVLTAGIEPSWALVFSQVVLSIGIPFALIPLVIFTSQKKLMREYTNRLPTQIAAGVVVAIILIFNIGLLTVSFG